MPLWVKIVLGVFAVIIGLMVAYSIIYFILISIALLRYG